MAHPFFQVPAYPWHREEARAFHKLLYQTLRGIPLIDRYYNACSAELVPLHLGQPVDFVWKEFLENITAKGVLQAFVEKVEVDFKKTPGMGEVIARIQAAIPAVRKKVISEDVVVLDQEELRTQMELIESSTSLKKVLVVRGGSRSGKSHGRYVFDSVAQDMSAVSVYVCQDLVVTVDDVVNLLFSTLESSNEMPARHTSPEAWYRQVCFKLKECASKGKKQVWIAVDDLGPALDGTARLDEEIRNFFDQFVLQMPNHDFRKWFRLMFIHYPDSVPVRWKKEHWIAERMDASKVTAKEVKEALKVCADSYDLKMLDADLEKRAQEIVANADKPVPPGEDQADRLQRIHDAVIQAINLMKATAASYAAAAPQTPRMEGGGI